MKLSTSLRASGILPALSKHTEPLPGTQGTSRSTAGSSGEGAGKQSANSVTPSAVSDACCRGIVRCGKHGRNLRGDPARGPSTISHPMCTFLWFPLLPLTMYISTRYFPFATNSSILGDTAVDRRLWLPFWRPAGKSGSKYSAGERCREDERRTIQQGEDWKMLPEVTLGQRAGRGLSSCSDKQSRGVWGRAFQQREQGESGALEQSDRPSTQQVQEGPGRRDLVFPRSLCRTGWRDTEEAGAVSKPPGKARAGGASSAVAAGGAPGGRQHNFPQASCRMVEDGLCFGSELGESGACLGNSERVSGQGLGDRVDFGMCCV
ncbi:uncharacterized protein LOC113938899 [Zalophus californianus]|uniref:Uncharacterized protein LOC113938899 n=1 Tax=Zalophus californianus TaxID=9704 RepID=A0A6J2FJS3_ZALCA|nr:uncharacterized protein LOC113938899 [Zalophus californianus]